MTGSSACCPSRRATRARSCRSSTRDRGCATRCSHTGSSTRKSAASTSGSPRGDEPMTEGGLHGREAILQIHASRRCNLACAHCYSSSSPQELGSLSPELVAQAVRDASAIGVRVISLSGGEPLLYGGL